MKLHNHSWCTKSFFFLVIGITLATNDHHHRLHSGTGGGDGGPARYAAAAAAVSSNDRTSLNDKMQQNKDRHFDKVYQNIHRSRINIGLETVSASTFSSSPIRPRAGNNHNYNNNNNNGNNDGGGGSLLSMTFDPFPPSSNPNPNNDQVDECISSSISSISSSPEEEPPLLQSLLSAALVTMTLLPKLLLSRRLLNSTYNVIVDYFRGRYFRTTLTRMERAYLRYYEFPAAIRAVCRTSSQICILFLLSYVFRLYMVLVDGPHSGIASGLTSGMTSGINSGITSGVTSGMNSGMSGEIMAGLKEGSMNDNTLRFPCQTRGGGIAYPCSLLWIGAVVGAGHACAMALAVWGGPLRLQATAASSTSSSSSNQPSPLAGSFEALARMIHHPIQWLKELEEWEYVSSMTTSIQRAVHLVMNALFGRRGGDPIGATTTTTMNAKGRTRIIQRFGGRYKNGRVVVFHPDPLLFPSTWLPLRWLQIIAVAKAFATNPNKYRMHPSPSFLSTISTSTTPPSSDYYNNYNIIPKLMKQYLIQLALGDEWNRVFLGEKRVGLGIIVIISYFIALICMVGTTFTINRGAAVMLLPSILAAMISGWMNAIVFWNRMGEKQRREALTAVGLGRR